jgi:hypothetical protein
MQRAELAGERLVLITIDFLITEDHDFPVEPRLVNFAELLVRKVFRKIDPLNFGADMRREAVNPYGLESGNGCHLCTP